MKNTVRILIVDDDAQNRYLLEILLKKNGYEVTAANNGAEALESAMTDPPKLVISDILMPVMDGFTLCHNWRANEELKGIPFIFYTATYTEAKDEEFALSLGADRFVLKPQDPEVLVEIVGEVTSRPRSAVARKSGDAAQMEIERLQKYSEALFRKLEKKVSDLESTNRDLERTIAERLQGEEALRTSETKYRIVADNTYHWEFWLDPEDRLLYISPSCTRITGRDYSDFIHDPELMRNIIHPEDRPRFEAHRDGVEKKRVTGSLEFRILHADGSVRWIAHDCLPVYGENGLFLGIRGSNHDVTETKRLEAQLRQSQKMETVGRLAGGIAHDLNNILTVIIGFSDILRTKLEKDDPLRGHIDEVFLAAERASNLTSGLLAFSRKQITKHQPVGLNDCIMNIEKFIQRVVGGDIRLKVRAMKESPMIHADSGQIEQVIMNLATNARDAMSSGGTLSIEIDEVGIDEQFVHAHGYGTPGRYAALSVSDTGIGMDETTCQRIFEPFFTTKEAGKGTGLGLSIVYGIMKEHDGYINVYSEPGRGTTFRLLFPAIEAGAGTKDTEVIGAPQGGEETLLVVDDDSATRQMLDTFLTSIGYRVILAVDGQDAVEKFREKADAIDLVIMDAIMPRKNGGEAYREIKAIRPDMKALLMSGFPSDVFTGHGLVGKGVELVLKPLRPTEFAKIVRRLIEEV